MTVRRRVEALVAGFPALLAWLGLVDQRLGAGIFLAAAPIAQAFAATNVDLTGSSASSG